MPLPMLQIDARKYQELLDEAVARIPVHTPEYSNFGKSDPGITLFELFAFMSENLLYQFNRIPERNRRKFLTLLGIPLQPGASAQGLVVFRNERGPRQALTLSDGLEVRAGQVPFRTEQGLDILPIEGLVYVKRRVATPSGDLKAYYRQLYASYALPDPVELDLYETVPVGNAQAEPLDVNETVDRSLWIALLLRETDKPANPDQSEAIKDDIRKALAGKVLSIGIVPAVDESKRRLSPGGAAVLEGGTPLVFEMPKISAGGGLPPDRIPQYASLDTRTDVDVLTDPGIVQVTLPHDVQELRLWNDLDPLEAGVDRFPPSLEDTALKNRLLTWIKVGAPIGMQARVQWLGINATRVTQRAHVVNERLMPGTGEPDQVRGLAKTPVIPGSVKLSVTVGQAASKVWDEVEDLLTAGSEVPVPDDRLHPGVKTRPSRQAEVFTVNPESGEIRCGDGMHGARWPDGAVLRADYDYGVGRLGNVNAGVVNSSPVLPSGITVTNPVRMWGGAEPETVDEGEKQITRYLQHRNRLVTVEDFNAIVRRTPGADINRVEVIPAFNPELIPNEPGDAPGAVTLVVIPQDDPAHPEAPVPTRPFLDAICRHINPGRLVTTEIFLRGPDYVDIWVSVGIEVRAAESIAQVREAVRTRLLAFLSPRAQTQAFSGETAMTGPEVEAFEGNGWPLRKTVVALELVTVASRVPGVVLVNEVLLAEGKKPVASEIPMMGVQLPRVRVAVSVGPATPLEQLRGEVSATTPATSAPKIMPVPVIPEECR